MKFTWIFDVLIHFSWQHLQIMKDIVPYHCCQGYSRKKYDKTPWKDNSSENTFLSWQKCLNIIRWLFYLLCLNNNNTSQGIIWIICDLTDTSKSIDIWKPNCSTEVLNISILFYLSCAILNHTIHPIKSRKIVRRKTIKN